jgi:hypothetical protein
MKMVASWDVWSVSFTATLYNKMFSDYQPCKVVKRRKIQRFKDLLCPRSQGNDVVHHRPDGGSTYLWIVGLLQRDYTALYPRRLSSSIIIAVSPSYVTISFCLFCSENATELLAKCIILCANRHSIKHVSEKWLTDSFTVISYCDLPFILVENCKMMSSIICTLHQVLEWLNHGEWDGQGM